MSLSYNHVKTPSQRRLQRAQGNIKIEQFTVDLAASQFSASIRIVDILLFAAVVSGVAAGNAALAGRAGLRYSIDST